MQRVGLLIGAAAIGWGAPLQPQDDVAPTPVVHSAVAPAPAPVADSNVAPFYAARSGAPIWLRDADSRAAAAKLVEILKRAPIDGLADGPALASSVETALASGTPDDDQIISTAWVRYAQALRRPVNGVSFGDPTLQLAPPSANAILGELTAAPSLANYLDAVSAVNPIYAALRQDAIAAGEEDDPHVRATLDRLRLVPAKGHAILVDAANAQLMMLENGEVVDTMKVIVGKPDFATPLLAGKIWYVTFNPYWHIPADVAKRKVAPIVLKRGVNYLKLARYQTVEAFGGDKEEPI
ncbi:MAG TPA: L,D-transpeptidase family protein, partial [Sphingomicrobium sp.]